MPIDYSKWENLDWSEDSDAEASEPQHGPQISGPSLGDAMTFDDDGVPQVKDVGAAWRLLTDMYNGARAAQRATMVSPAPQRRQGRDSSSCEMCQSFVVPTDDEEKYLYHYAAKDDFPEFGNLRQRAEAGCTTCQFFFKAIRSRADVSQNQPTVPVILGVRDEGDRGDGHINFVSRDTLTSEERGSPLLTTLVLRCLPDPNLAEKDADVNIEILLGLFAAGKDDQDIRLNTTLDPGWIKDINKLVTACKDDHAACKAQGQPFQPTRLLAIRRSAQAVSIINQSQSVASYVALSYCWGPEPPDTREYVTTSQNLASRTAPYEIETAKLPASVGDAIKLAHALGYEYIWIDAMCILQDSATDWEHEAALMAQVYSFADLTLAIQQAQSAYEGFLSPPYLDKPTVDITSKIPTAIRRKDTVMKLCEIAQRNNLRDGKFLDTRAWCLQEEVLSTRILYCHPGRYFYSTHLQRMSEYKPQPGVSKSLGFADQELGFVAVRSSRNESAAYLSCYDFRCSNDGPAAPATQPLNPLLMSMFFGENQNLAGIKPSPRSGQNMSREQWRILVQDYARRKLTYQKDKLAASAGLARKFAEALDDEYLAGLWRSTFGIDLCWDAYDEKSHDVFKSMSSGQTKFRQRALNNDHATFASTIDPTIKRGRASTTISVREAKAAMDALEDEPQETNRKRKRTNQGERPADLIAMWVQASRSVLNVDSYIAPTWSWASCSRALEFGRWLDRAESINLQVLESVLVPRGKDPYGPLSKGHVLVSAKLLPIGADQGTTDDLKIFELYLCVFDRSRRETILSATERLWQGSEKPLQGILDGTLYRGIRILDVTEPEQSRRTYCRVGTTIEALAAEVDHRLEGVQATTFWLI